MFLIASFYYNRDAGLLDGWFQVPPMSEEGRRVKRQSKKVYEDFKEKEETLLEKEATLLVQELLENEVNVDLCIPSLLNPDEHQQPALVSRVENLGMDTAMPDDQGLECAPVGGMHEGLALSNGHSFGFQEGSALPVAQLPPITESGMSLNGSNRWNLLQTLTSETSLLNSAEQQLPLLGSQAENSRMAIAMLDDQGLERASQSFGGIHEGFVTSTGHSLGFQEESAVPISERVQDTQTGMDINNSNQLLNFPQIVHNQQQLITYQNQQLQERDAQISVLQNENRIQRQQLEEYRIHISQLESHHFVQQQLQVINQGVPTLEMEQSMPQQNHPCRPHGSAFW